MKKIADRRIRGRRQSTTAPIRPANENISNSNRRSLKKSISNIEPDLNSSWNRGRTDLNSSLNRGRTDLNSSWNRGRIDLNNILHYWQLLGLHNLVWDNSTRFTNAGSGHPILFSVHDAYWEPALWPGNYCIKCIFPHFQTINFEIKKFFFIQVLKL